MSNCRGITFNSVIVKLFAMILEQRIAKWADERGVRAHGLAGMQSSTAADNMHRNHSICALQQCWVTAELQVTPVHAVCRFSGLHSRLKTALPVAAFTAMKTCTSYSSAATHDCCTTQVLQFVCLLFATLLLCIPGRQQPCLWLPSLP